nr:hypothetical protein [Tanacetum cinerariifolium]
MKSIREFDARRNFNRSPGFYIHSFSVCNLDVGFIGLDMSVKSNNSYDIVSVAPQSNIHGPLGGSRWFIFLGTLVTRCFMAIGPPIWITDDFEALVFGLNTFFTIHGVWIYPIDLSPYTLKGDQKNFKGFIALFELIGFDMKVDCLKLILAAAVRNHQGIPQGFCGGIFRKEVAPNSEIPKAMFPLLEEFSDVFPHELPDALPPLCDIQHHIDLEPSSQLPNMPHDRMSPGEHEEMSPCAQPRGPLDLMSLHVSGSVPKKVQDFVKGLPYHGDSSHDDLVGNSRTNFVYPWGNDEGPSIEKQALLFLDAQDRVKEKA